MSVLDRVRQHQRTEQDSRSSTPEAGKAVVVVNPVLVRARQLITFALEQSKGHVPWMVETIVHEMLEDMDTMVDGNELAEYLMVTAGILKWAATGNLEDIPAHIRDEATERLALLPGEAVSTA